MDSSTAPPTTAGPLSKLRLMCSYGGHIVPRPMDKTLCYAGGETRIVAVDRRTAVSLSSLTSHLSKSLLNGRPFALKYQLPNHDLDSLISVSSDEDLANMIEEYDRLAPSSSRLRFFLFPTRSTTGHDGDGGGDLHEDWFIDALRNVGVVRSSDSESEGKVAASGGGSLVDSATSLAESIILEKNSSFGSTSSSASAANSPAIRSGAGVEECVGVRVQDFKAAFPLVDSMNSDSSLASQIFSPQGIVYQDAAGFNESKVVAANLLDTESNFSDQSPRGDLLTSVQVSGYVLSRPMDQQQQQVPPPQSSATPQLRPQQYIHPAPQSHYVTQYYPSPVPVGSYPAMYQPYVQTHQPVQYQMNTQYGFPVYMFPVGQAHNPCDMSMQSTLATVQNVAQGHPQMASNPVMVASPIYYEEYKSAVQPHEYSNDLYRTPIQAVNVPSGDRPTQPQGPSNPVMVGSSVVYDGHKPAAPAPEYAAKVYRTSAVPTQPANLPSDDHRAQVVAFPPVSQSSQPVDSTPLENTSYMSEYEDPMHAQIYKTQPPAPTLPYKLQTATNAAAVMLSETLAQLHVDNTKH